MSWHVRVIANRYADSVRLMGAARDVRGLEGVDACEIGIGTAANLEALAALGATATATPADIVIAVRADDDGAAGAALEAAERGLAAPVGGGSERSRALPRSVATAAAGIGRPGVALVSVPGEYAALAAHQALTRGLHAFVFSDHVTVEQEIELKRRGRDRGLLVMGPGCGTAMLGEVGLGFVNVVRRGPVGVVAAAGTGAQEVACLVDASGGGVSHIIGVGGRDLSAAVGGIMFREAIRLLAEDDETETLLLVSKPPAPEVVAALGDVVPRDKRVVAAFVGAPAGDAPFELHATLEGGACAAAGAPAPDCPALDDKRGAGGGVFGLFSGGSLAHEAATILRAELGPIAGNVGDGPERGEHTILDLGEEEYTRGRPHPMVDLDVRIDFLAEAADDDKVGCVLLDVVLGRTAHPDPAGGLAPSIERVARRVPVVAHVCGTPADPQDADRQVATLRSAGAVVAPSNAAAARLAARAVGAAA
jgi:FdrA protein